MTPVLMPTPTSEEGAGPPALRAYLQSLVDRRKTPGAQYVAVGPHGLIASFAVGWADIGRQQAMTPTTTLMAYSMSKTVTAIAVLQLVEEGRVALDLPAARYVPSWPYDPGVTVRELLTHTGGLPNPIPLRWVHPANAHETFDEHSALQAVLDRHGRQASTPGTRFTYSNIGYWLLGALVEHVTGAPFAQHVTTRIFEPLGLTPRDVGFRVTGWETHATGYLERWTAANLFGRWLIDPALLGPYEGGWRRIGAHYPNGPAFGGIVGSAAAFARLLQDQLQPRSALLGEETRTHLYEAQSTRRGTRVPMTLGWHVGRTLNVSEDGSSDVPFFKEGGGGGFHCLMRLSPERRLGSVLMTNATGVDVRSCLDEADRLLRPRRPF